MDESMRGSYNIIAVNADEATNMKNAIVEYKQSIDDVLNKIIAIEQSEYAVGFKGATQTYTIKKYIDETVAEMKKMTSFISEFEVAIEKVITNYLQQNFSVKTGAVQEASVQGEGDLSGVKEFSE